MSLYLKYIIEEQLIDLFKGNKPFIIAYLRDHCPDSIYGFDNFLWPYATNYEGNKVLYVFEFERNGHYNLETKTYPLSYWRLLEKYLLSETSNPILGFDKGHVPSFQYVIPNGKLPPLDPSVIKDMCVIYNDARDETIDDKVIIKKTFFDGRRPLKYTDINLKGRELPAWRRAEIGVFHNEAAKKFFDYYLPRCP
ncbi:MAG TPA: hypothetical protein DCX17_01265 [Firmicutes bacterium]|jgi:hypothetical protein|nr:hypothetical protein [Bacillota bacterium]